MNKIWGSAEQGHAIDWPTLQRPQGPQEEAIYLVESQRCVAREMLEDTVSGAWAWMKPAMGMGWCPEQAAAFLLFAELSSPASVPPGGGEAKEKSECIQAAQATRLRETEEEQRAREHARDSPGGVRVGHTRGRSERVVSS